MAASASAATAASTGAETARSGDGDGARLDDDHARLLVVWPAIIRPSVPRSSAVGGQRLREPPGIDHGDAVGERQQLVEVLGDEEDAGAAFARGEEPAMDLGLRADVEAAGRLVGEDQPRACGRARGRGSASGYCRRRGAAPARPVPGSGRRSRGSRSWRAARIAAKRRKPPRWKSRLAELLERDVLGDGHRADHAVDGGGPRGCGRRPSGRTARGAMARDRRRRRDASSRRSAGRARRPERRAPPGRCRKRRQCRRSRPRRR